MAFFYVKLGGTATGNGGRYTSAKTGSWAAAFAGTSEYYDNLHALNSATNPPTNGDTVLMSDVGAGAVGHTEGPQFNETQGAGVAIISVDDDDVEVYAKGAEQSCPLTLRLRGNWTAFGVTFTATGSNSIDVYSNANISIVDGLLKHTGSSNYKLQVGSDGAFLRLIDSDIDVANSGVDWLQVSSGGRIEWRGGSLLSATSRAFQNYAPENGGGSVDIIGVDLSNMSGVLLNRTAHSYTRDGYQLRMRDCRLSGISGFEAAIGYRDDDRIEIYNCGATSAEREYQFYLSDVRGTLQNDTSFYRDNSTAFTESGQKVSAKAITTAHASYAKPFEFELPAKYAALSNGSTDTLRLHLLSSDSGLTDKDVWVQVIYPDGTNRHTANQALSATLNPLAAGSALDANSDAWTGRTTEARYQIDIDTSGDVGADCVPILRAYVAKASTTIYFDTTVGVVSG